MLISLEGIQEAICRKGMECIEKGAVTTISACFVHGARAQEHGGREKQEKVHGAELRRQRSNNQEY